MLEVFVIYVVFQFEALGYSPPQIASQSPRLGRSDLDDEAKHSS